MLACRGSFAFERLALQDPVEGVAQVQARFPNGVLLLLHITIVLFSLLSMSGCISSTTSLDVEHLKVFHQTEPVGRSNESTNVLLVEREDGRLLVITDRQIAIYDHDFDLESKDEFKHKYYGFGLIQGPDGLWFAGYEWGSWMFGVLHGMNFDVHAMPLGNAEPTFTWPCKNCSDLRVQRLVEPMRDYLFAASVRQATPWVGFDVDSGERFGADTQVELVETLVANRIDKPSSALQREEVRGEYSYASRNWWRNAYATCDAGSRVLWGMRGGSTRNCVWHPQRSNSDAEFTVGVDGTFNRLVLTDNDTNETIDSWDLSGLVDVEGFSNVIGWFRFPDAQCEEASAGSRLDECARTIAVVSGTWENCYEKSRCEEVTGVFDLEDGGHARLIKLIQAPSRAALRLSDGRIVVSVGHNLVLIDPPRAMLVDSSS